MSNQSASAITASRMNCMEVWGGNCAAEQRFSRPGLDVWVWSRSKTCAEEGGGDLHLVSSCASGRVTRLLLADICGHGSMFRGVAMGLRDLMKRNVNRIQQSQFVRDMKRGLDNAAVAGAYASTMISTYFAPTRSFSLCNAGHPPPFLFRNRDSSWTPLRRDLDASADGASASGAMDLGEYQHFQVKLEVGDMVLGYGNTLTECRSENGRTIGVDGLLRRVAGLDPTEPQSMAGQLIQSLENEVGDNLQAEDATLMLCKVTDSSVGWRNNLMAPIRLLGSVSDRTQLS